MNGKTALTLALVAALGVAGCGIIPGKGSSDYSRDQARQEQTIRRGVVENVREVNIEGTRSGAGAVAGGAVGGVAGSRVGGGRGQIAGAVVGGVLGAVAGAATEQQVTKQKGLEVEVALDSGKSIVVVQGADEQFRVGDRVRVLSGGGETRVTH